MNKQITLYASDTTLTFDVRKVSIVSSLYQKEIKKNEYHAPKAAIIIFETENKIIKFFFILPIIYSDNFGLIVIHSKDIIAKIKLKKPWFTKQELKKAEYLVKIYKVKSETNLFPDEIIEYSWAENIIEMNKLLTKSRIPVEIEGAK